MYCVGTIESPCCDIVLRCSACEVVLWCSACEVVLRSVAQEAQGPLPPSFLLPPPLSTICIRGVQHAILKIPTYRSGHSAPPPPPPKTCPLIFTPHLLIPSYMYMLDSTVLLKYSHGAVFVNLCLGRKLHVHVHDSAASRM